MQKWIKSTFLSTLIVATSLSFLGEATAGQRHRGGGYYGSGGNYHGGYQRPPSYNRDYYRQSSKRRSRQSDAVAAGIIGLGVGAIIGSALAQPSSPPPPRAVYPTPQPIYGGLEPWSPGWYDYCGRRYRSFNPNSGTFRGYDGQDHFCVAN